jgi:hypothetical protein
VSAAVNGSPVSVAGERSKRRQLVAAGGYVLCGAISFPYLTVRFVRRLHDGSWPAPAAWAGYLLLASVCVHMVVTQARLFRRRRRDTSWPRHREPDE